MYKGCSSSTQTSVFFRLSASVDHVDSIEWFFRVFPHFFFHNFSLPCWFSSGHFSCHDEHHEGPGHQDTQTMSTKFMNSWKGMAVWPSGKWSWEFLLQLFTGSSIVIWASACWVPRLLTEKPCGLVQRILGNILSHVFSWLQAHHHKW